MKGRILAVDDDKNMTDVIVARLARRDFEVISANSGDAAKQIISNQDVDVVVTDLKMRGMTGIDLCGWIQANRPEVPVIVITAFGSLDTAVAAIRAGAYDFITKPLEIESLQIAIERALQHKHLHAEVNNLRQVVANQQGFGELLGQSNAIQTIRDLLSKIANADASVLIGGESGTGKEVVARLLHQQSQRRDGPFVAVNCAAMPAPLLESELFGHVRGAFTDAKQARQGLMVQAHLGTLFLDEIGDMPLDLQPKLLRALEEKHVRPVGGEQDVSFDARVVAASNHDLQDDCEHGHFRQDLYYRLNVLTVDMPPLRARGNDILQLAQHFIQTSRPPAGRRVLGLSAPAAEKLLAYSWPGNVRELKNCIERAVTLTEREQIIVEDLPERIRSYANTPLVFDSDNPDELIPMTIVEQRYITKVMQAVNGNKTLAARVLGFDRTTLYRKLEQYRISLPTK